jgi:hypothetical protein
MTLELTSAVDFVVTATKTHEWVTSANQLDNYTLKVEQKVHGTVKVAAVTKSWLDENDVDDLIETYPDLDGIVNSGKHVHCSAGAKRRGTKSGVAVHVFREYMSALGRSNFSSHENGLIPWALKTFKAHSKVTDVEQVCELRIRLSRSGLAAIEFVPTSIYTLGVADLMETLEWHEGVDAVVNFIGHNQYTEQARTRAIQLHVGLFTPKEMFGALNHAGEKFYGYKPAGKSR